MYYSVLSIKVTAVKNLMSKNFNSIRGGSLVAPLADYSFPPAAQKKILCTVKYPRNLITKIAPFAKNVST
jgi:hypothetical protein